MALIYNSAKAGFLDGVENWSSLTYKVMLVSSSYVPNADHEFVTDGPSAAELNGSGYVPGFGNSGRKTLSGMIVNKNNLFDRAEVDAADVVWPSINAGTAAAVVVIRETGGSDASSKLIAYLDFTPPVTFTGIDFTLVWNAMGLFTAA